MIALCKQCGRVGNTVANCAGRGRHSWELPNDPMFVERVRDVVGPCLDPTERTVVLCVDQKTHQALNPTAPVFPILPGTPADAA